MAQESKDEREDRSSANGREKLSQDEHEARLERISANQRKDWQESLRMNVRPDWN